MRTKPQSTWRGRVKRGIRKKIEGERKRRRGKGVAVRRTWWTASMDVRRGPWRHTCTSPRHPGESKQPYKVAGLRFNPKFISSISKGLSRGPERVSERLTRTTLPSPTPPRCSSSCLARSSPLLSLSFSLVGASECAMVHRCIASTPLHYDSYIAIFIISAAHRCPRSRLTSIVFFLLVFFPFFLSPVFFRALRRPFLFWQITAGGFKALRREPRDVASRCTAPRRDHSMESSLEEIPPGVRSAVTRIVED